MPTGYTAKIAEGIEFEEYALLCARQFGVCITMRDDPWDAPIPEKFEESDYHKRSLAEAEADLAEFKSATTDQLKAKFESEKVERVKPLKEGLEEKRELLKKYEKMLAQVRLFEAPSEDHVNFRDFMESQITQSIEFDCNLEYYAKELKAVDEWTFDSWKEMTEENLTRSVEYHKEQMEAETNRTDNRNKWISQLRTAIEETNEKIKEATG